MKKKFPFLILSLFFNCAFIKAQSWSELGGLNTFASSSCKGITTGYVKSICSDPSGNIYAVGDVINAYGFKHVGKYDGSSWRALGGNVCGVNGLDANNVINSICSDPSGNIYAAGEFTNSSGKKYVAKYDGNAWSELGGLNGLSANFPIHSVHSDASGNIYATGEFTNSFGYPYVAKYDGSSWSELGGLNGLGAYYYPYRCIIACIISDSFGNIYAAGQFSNISGNVYVAKYNGSTWSALGGPNGGFQKDAANNVLGFIESLCIDTSGNIYAAGNFINSLGKRYVAKYNGNAWSELGGLNGLSANTYINSVCSDASGNIYAAGYFWNSSFKRYVAKYDGSTWGELGGLNGLSANERIRSIISDASGNIYAAGEFTNSFLNGNTTSHNPYVAQYGFATGIDEINIDGIEISVYPNPSIGDLNLQISSKNEQDKIDRIEIDNLIGEKILEQTINANHQTVNTKLNAGIYLVKLFIGENSYSKKIIVE